MSKPSKILRRGQPDWDRYRPVIENLRMKLNRRVYTMKHVQKELGRAPWFLNVTTTQLENQVRKWKITKRKIPTRVMLLIRQHLKTSSPGQGRETVVVYKGNPIEQAELSRRMEKLRRDIDNGLLQDQMQRVGITSTSYSEIQHDLEFYTRDAVIDNSSPIPSYVVPNLSVLLPKNPISSMNATETQVTENHLETLIPLNNSIPPLASIRPISFANLQHPRGNVSRIAQNNKSMVVVAEVGHQYSLEKSTIQIPTSDAPLLASENFTSLDEFEAIVSPYSTINYYTIPLRSRHATRPMQNIDIFTTHISNADLSTETYAHVLNQALRFIIDIYDPRWDDYYSRIHEVISLIYTVDNFQYSLQDIVLRLSRLNAQQRVQWDFGLTTRSLQPEDQNKVIELIDLLLELGTPIDSPDLQHAAINTSAQRFAHVEENIRSVRKFTLYGKRTVSEVRTEYVPTPLFIAVYGSMTHTPRNYLQIILHLLLRGADANAQNCDGNTPLHMFLEGYHFVEPGRRFYVDTNHDIVEIMQVLDALLQVSPTCLKQQNRAGNTPVHTAVQLDEPRIIKQLLLNVHCKPALMLENADGFRPVHFVAMQGHIETTRAFLDAYPGELSDHFVQNSQSGQTLFHIAMNTHMWLCDSSRTTSLQLFMALDDEQVHTYLAQVDFKGQTVLHIAAAKGLCQLVAALLETESVLSTINHKNYEGKTPLHLAALNEHFMLAQLLVTTGASTTVKNDAGDLAEDCLRAVVLKRLKQPDEYSWLTRSHEMDTNLEVLLKHLKLQWAWTEPDSEIYRQPSTR